MLTVLEAAALAQVSPRYIRKMCQLGKIEARKMGRDWLVNAESLQLWIERGLTKKFR